MTYTQHVWRLVLTGGLKHQLSLSKIEVTFYRRAFKTSVLPSSLRAPILCTVLFYEALGLRSCAQECTV